MTNVNQVSSVRRHDIGFHPKPTSQLQVGAGTIDTGRYLIEILGPGDVRVTDRTNNTNFRAWGDPHITTGDNDRAHFEDGPLTIVLQDGTQLTYVPTAKDANGVAWLDKLAVKRGNEAVCVTDIKTAPKVGQVGRNAAMIDGCFDHGTVMYAGDQVDDLFFQVDGQELVGTDPRGGQFGGEWDLDGRGGTAPTFTTSPIRGTPSFPNDPGRPCVLPPAPPAIWNMIEKGLAELLQGGQNPFGHMDPLRGLGALLIRQLLQQFWSNLGGDVPFKPIGPPQNGGCFGRPVHALRDSASTPANGQAPANLGTTGSVGSKGNSVGGSSAGGTSAADGVTSNNRVYGGKYSSNVDIFTLIAMILHDMQADLATKAQELASVSNEINTLRGQSPQGGQQAGGDTTQMSNLESKRSQLLFEIEQLKQKITEMSDLRSNMSKTDHETAMTMIRNVGN